MEIASKGMMAKSFISFVVALGVGWFVLSSGFAQSATSTPVPTPTPQIFGKCLVTTKVPPTTFSIVYGCVAAGTVVGTDVPVSAVGFLETDDSGAMSATFTVNNNGTTTKFTLGDGQCTTVDANGTFSFKFGTVTPATGFADTFDGQFSSLLFDTFDGSQQSELHFAASSSSLVLVGTCN